MLVLRTGVLVQYGRTGLTVRGMSSVEDKERIVGSYKWFIYFKL